MFGLWFSLKVHGLQIGKSVYHGVFTRWMFGLWFPLTVHGLQIGAPQNYGFA